RQEMVDTIQGGLASVAHYYIGPEQPEWGAIQNSVVKYDFDSRRATQELDDLGFKRGADGFIRDASGQRTTLGVNATVTQINQKSMASVADYWQRLGFAVDQVTIPLQRQNDLEFFVSFPGFLVLRGNRIGAQFLNQHGSRAA